MGMREPERESAREREPAFARRGEVTRRAQIIVDASAGSGRLAVIRSLAQHSPVEADVRGLLRTDDRTQALASVPLVLLGATVADGTPVEAVARPLRDSHPHIGIFVVATQGEIAGARLVGLAHAGVDELFFTDAQDDSHRLPDHVRRRIGVPPPETPLRVIGQAHVTRNGDGRVIMWLLRNAHRNPSVDEVAAHFGMHRTTVWRRLREAGLPDAGTILRCGRVLHAAQLMGDSGLDVRAVADRLGMDSVAGLRMLLLRARRDEAVAAAFLKLGWPQSKG